tara:strand:- start:866 stop:1513 length:648 start_codon:yes stop_codon:yes gene_type:complete
VKSIKNKVLRSEPVKWEKLTFLQPDNFKELGKKQFERLSNSIKKGFAQPFFVWQSPEGVIYCLDGFHRRKVLQDLKKKGYKIPVSFPANFIDCADLKEAKKLVLTFSSIYARVTDDGLYNFLEINEIEFDSVKFDIDIPELNLEKFEEFFINDPADTQSDQEPDPAENLIETAFEPFDKIKLGYHTIEIGEANVFQIDQLVAAWEKLTGKRHEKL